MPKTIWVTSDTHFWHEEALALYKRDFPTVEAMNDAFIDAINACVGKGDELWHLGDFVAGLAWKKQPRKAVKLARDCRERIRCSTVHLVRGNHDPRLPGFDRLFDSVHDIASWKGWERGEHRIVLCHYPMLAWQGRWNGSLHLHGHLHGGLPSQSRSADVGVDCHRYRPVTMETMLARCARQPVQHLDEYQRPRTR
jgi:calcineurin-like phosphoesterase family protein